MMINARTVCYTVLSLSAFVITFRVGSARPLPFAASGSLGWTLLCQLLLIPVNAPNAEPGPRRDALLIAAYLLPLLSLPLAAILLRPIGRGVLGAVAGSLAGVVLATVLLAWLELIPSRFFL